MPLSQRLASLFAFSVFVYIFSTRLFPGTFPHYDNYCHVGFKNVPPVLFPDDSIDSLNVKHNIFSPKFTSAPLHDFASRESGSVVVRSGKSCYNAAGMLENDMDR